MQVKSLVFQFKSHGVNELTTTTNKYSASSKHKPYKSSSKLSGELICLMDVSHAECTSKHAEVPGRTSASV